MYASLSIDLDNQWSYQKTHGDAGWEDYPSYLDVIVPRILGELKKLEIDATFFIVGKDAELPKNSDAMKQIGDSGHEIANHSFSHDPKLAGFADDALLEEVAKAEHWIEERTGFRPVGFRAPGFSHSPALMKLLSERGYLYDASTFPT
ncbi:MAG: polysaccharide deacetylase family protein, partial [Verrucomicrobiota bacterium]